MRRSTYSQSVFKVVLFLSILFFAEVSSVNAVVVAYWRFEEGIADTQATGDNSVIDSSGNGHHGDPIDDGFDLFDGPTYRANVPVSTIPRQARRTIWSLSLIQTQRGAMETSEFSLRTTQTFS